MDFQLKSLRLDAATAASMPALVVLVADHFAPGRDALSALIQRAVAGGDFRTENGKLLPCYGSAGIAADRVVLADIGDGQPPKVRAAVTAAFGALKSSPATALTLCFAQPAAPQAVSAAVLAAAHASYIYGATKSESARRKERPEWQQLIVGAPDAAAARGAFEQAAAIAQGVRLAREWANRPANYATPAMLGEAALALARLPRIDCDVLGPKEVAKLGMGAFQAVAQGSRQELRFIVLRYRGAAKTDAPVALVGKGITFDSGGISLKPGPEMDEMKFDMSGAASVLGVFRALAELRPRINVVGLIPACENLPDGRAVKPGDVVTSLSGQTIEILNTDAEGRLILCDALHYARRFEPGAVIDIATLTGACVIALGAHHTGIMGNNDELVQELVSAGVRGDDRAWALPLTEEYVEQLKSNFADMANISNGREAGAITAAGFLSKFTQGMTWAHLDIAGTAWLSGAQKGSSGRPMSLLADFLVQRTQSKG